MPPLNFFDPYYAALHGPFVFLLGATLGSFYNVCIYRIPRGVSLSMPPSHCYVCGTGVKWYDNIPLVSYWVLGGKCRKCAATFSIRYFMIELLTALLFLSVYLVLGHTLAIIPALLLVSMMIVATFTDIDHWIIPDRISIGGTFVGIALAAIWPVGLAPLNPLAVSNGIFSTAKAYPDIDQWWDLFTDVGMLPFNWNPIVVPAQYLPLCNAVLGAALGFAGLWLVGFLGSIVFRKEAMGFGDVKLFAMIGAFLGPMLLVHVMLIACILGMVAGLAGWMSKLVGKPPVIPTSVAPLSDENRRIDPTALEEAPLGSEEREQVRKALENPGAVGAQRHHLPFGPWLAAGSVIVYLFGPWILAFTNGLFVVE